MALPRVQPIERATNRAWDEWMAYLESIGASELSHTDIAARALALMDDTVDNPEWWAQSVAVTYEQAIGRRIPGQQSDGTFEMSVSKTTPHGMADLIDRWEAFAATDPAVLDLVAGEARVSGTDKRITWRSKANHGSTIIVTSEPNRDGRASIIARQTGLTSAEQNDAAKATWREILTRFLEASS